MLQIERLRACWTIPGADAALAGRLLSRQVQSTPVSRWITEVTLVLAAVLLAVLAWLDGSGRPWAPLWLTGVVLTCVGKVRLRWLAASGRGRSPRRSMRALSAHTFCVGAVFSSYPAWLFVQTNDGLRMVIAAVVAGAICSGALNAARMPVSGLAWVGTLTGVSGLALAASGRVVDVCLLAALLAYAVLLVSDMLLLSRQFVSRCQAEFEAERQTQMVSLLLSDVEGSSRDWFWECDTAGRLTHASALLPQLLGVPSDQVPGRSLVTLLRGEAQPLEIERRTALQLLGERLAGQRPFRELVVPLQVAGEPQWWALSGKPLLDVSGRLVGWRGVGVDVSAARRHERDLRRLAGTDPLTGLTNRHGFNQFLDGCFAPPDPDAGVGLLTLDLDAFKSVNDAHGHGVGDRLLHAVAQRLRPLCGAGECLARLGGDEYALVVPGEGSSARLMARGEALLQALRLPFSLGDLRIEVRGSIGLARTSLHASDAQGLQQAADMALYAAKDQGRDTIRLYDHEIGQRAYSRARLIRDLAEARESGQLRLDYQPVFDARTGEVQCAEALLRWHHPQRGLMAPLSFISLAEETGLIVPIGAWVLRQACSDAMGWPQPLKVAVNLSAVQLHSRGLVDEVRRVLADTGLPPHRLELELTESALVHDGEAVADTLVALHRLGVSLALDDFGTGFSSLSYLQRFRFDRLKIDRSFVQPLAGTPSAASIALVRAIVGLADALGMRCTAEGIEHAEQTRLLQGLGCGALQGFLLARPMPASQVGDCRAGEMPPGADERQTAPPRPVVMA
ncbi:diguanylate cyclase (GGDEF)-like protein [Sphaerotilus hippei]|uniref:Diguanylate cyclase (GGDEF)-like protein n=1 Tax=Sphaerotilus hippei TaxID=744406 RepID=A0A318H6N7_9BURK|nr:EAL domain-containing protein [Sphaerotilus hippei]PXW99391.1 diguanylate cyclase (GGDEF)-like protein [Sphaerotilus hippei]